MKVVGIGAGAVIAIYASSASAGDYYISGSLSGVFRDTYAVRTAQLSETQTPASGIRVTVNGLPGGPLSVPEFRTTRAQARTNFHPGLEADLALGRRFGLGRYGTLRAEAEIGFRDYQVGTTTVTALPGQPLIGTIYTLKTTSGLHQQRYAETADLFYDFPRVLGLTPYAGGGVGYQEGVSTSGDRFQRYLVDTGLQADLVPTTIHLNSSSANDGTWFGEAGVAVRLGDRLSLVPAYRFSQTFSVNKPIHLMRMALRYSF